MLSSSISFVSLDLELTKRSQLMKCMMYFLTNEKHPLELRALESLYT
jgi:hypothetical protein